LELVHPAGSVHEFLLARIKRVARVANANEQLRLDRTCLDHVAAGATDFRLQVLRMNVRFHEKESPEASHPIGHDKTYLEEFLPQPLPLTCPQARPIYEQIHVMVCQFCKQKEATVHLTQIVENEVKKVDLCEACAKEKGVNDPSGFSLA